MEEIQFIKNKNKENSLKDNISTENLNQFEENENEIEKKPEKEKEKENSTNKEELLLKSKGNNQTKLNFKKITKKMSRYDKT
ncbi:hypothetical protein M0813_21563 [Anaeramoeba flamelloides]|uniref:Uncharacterized protein n=1 Tax=Anaeramoeba flamelloides TaxID=1746091 RepID=A0ABQ8YI73_9EUKA|nr:hypothetical protein M0813_21563 [Anaeramoeba flamelloides]